MIPLFQYAWEGAYRFRSTDGPDWAGFERDSWALVEYIPPKELAAYQTKRQDLTVRARGLLLHIDDLRTALKEEKLILPLELPFLQWLAGVKEDYKIKDELSILLNHIALSQGLQQYQIVSTIVPKCFSAEVRGLREGEPCWVYGNSEHQAPFLGEDVLVHAHLFLKPGKNDEGFSELRNPADIKLACEWVQSRRLVHKYEVTSFRVEHADNKVAVEIRVRDRVRWIPYERGRRAWGLPIPGKSKSARGNHKPIDEPIASSSPEVCVSSPTVRASLAKLSEVWQDRSAKAVLITAPPGSGKENFARSIPYGLGRVMDDIPTRALSENEQEDMIAVFGQETDKGKHFDGLLAKGADKAVFIDEAHYPLDGTGIRSALLRPLENGEYSPLGSTETRSCKKTIFLFASSFPLRASAPRVNGPSTLPESLEDLKPPDFWTRVTHHIDIPHPLKGLADAELDQALHGFFRHFWWERALDHFGVNAFPFQGDDSEPAARTAVLRDHLATMLDEDVLKLASTTFATSYLHYLSSQAPPTPIENVSLRGIRSIVARLFSKALNNLLRGELPLDSDALRGLIDNHVSDVVPFATLKKVKTPPTPDPEKLA